MSYCRNGQEVRESTEIEATEKNRKKAERALKQRLGEVIAEKHGGPAFIEPAQRRIRINELLTALEQDYRVRDKCSPQFVSHMKRIRDAFGLWRAVNLAAEPESIDKYIKACKVAGLAPATINRGTQLLAQAYKLAIDRKQLKSAPVVRHLPERNARQGFFEDALWMHCRITCRILSASGTSRDGGKGRSLPCCGQMSKEMYFASGPSILKTAKVVACLWSMAMAS
jgi:hypothetical protein